MKIKQPKTRTQIVRRINDGQEELAHRVTERETNPITYKLRTAHYMANKQGPAIFQISESERIQCLQVISELGYIQKFENAKKKSAVLLNKNSKKILLQDVKYILDMVEDNDMLGQLIAAEGSYDHNKVFMQEAIEKYEDSSVSIADIPYDIPDYRNEKKQLNRNQIQTLLETTTDMENAYDNLPIRRMRSMWIIGSTVKTAIDMAIDYKSMSSLTEECGLDRVTLYNWRRRNEVVYALPGKLSQLATALPGYVVDLETIPGKAEFGKAKDMPDFMDVDLHDKYQTMIERSPTLKKKYDAGEDIYSLSMSEVERIYIDDTTKDAVAAKVKSRDMEIREQFQQDQAYAAGLLPLYSLRDMDVEDPYMGRTSEFRTCPIDFEDDTGYAIKINNNDYLPALFEGETVLVSPSEDIKTINPIRVIFQYKDKEGILLSGLGTLRCRSDEFETNKGMETEHIFEITHTIKDTTKVLGFINDSYMKEGNVTDVIDLDSREFKIDHNAKLLFAHKVMNVLGHK